MTEHTGTVRFAAAIFADGAVVAYYVVGAMLTADGEGWTVWRHGRKDFRATYARRMTVIRLTAGEAAEDLALLMRAVEGERDARLEAVLWGNRSQLPAELRGVVSAA